MLSLDKVGIDFGGNWLLREASYQFAPGDRVGLIGRNGAGKSTLLRMIAGDISPSEGNIHFSGKTKIAFFSQDLLSFQTEKSAVEVAREAFAEQLKLKDEIDALLEKMESGEEDPELWDQLAKKQAEFETMGGPGMDAVVHGVLSGLGFKAEEHDMPFHTFSGGWRMRVLLAKMLLTEPDYLLLDEPTNHLDLPSIQWLESYLKNFAGACIIVSHDRMFMDRMAKKVLEISLRRLHVYNGNYGYYLKEKDLRKEQHLRAYENQQKHIAEQERFINRFKAKATKARQAQSKLKQLEKLERIEAPEEEGFNLKIRFVMNQTSGKEVLKLNDIGKSYGPKEILRDTGGEILRSDKIGLIGANGLGKSTLLRIIAERESFEGEHKLGYNVNFDFFAQHQLEALNLKNTILEEVQAAATGKTETEVRNVLGSFMFSGEEVDKKISVLSGGEKSRVALAKTLLSEANFLLLDEPTNHLDIQSIEMLVEALDAYPGTYVVVSHDRFFLQRVSNKVWYIEEKQIKEYPGTYEEYAEWKARQDAELSSTNNPTQQEKEEKKQDSNLSYKEKRKRQNLIRKLTRDQEKFENEIESKEAKQAELEKAMADPENARDFQKLSDLQAQFDKLGEELMELTEKWEEVSMQLEEMGEE
ncbi:MAG: ABC-F family ATP-binding cassette domain-containing protein [Bacteroidota bacterium]